MPLPHRRSSVALCIAAFAAACGGGGGGSSLPPVTALSVAGTAAQGAAIAGAAVQVKCAIGSGTATTRGDGTYSLEVASGSLPCIVEVSAGGVTLHSVAPGTGNGAVTLNVTPLTELIVARVGGKAPAELFAAFDGTAQARLSTSAVAAAIADTRAALQGAVDLGGIDPIRDPLVAANGSTPGNALDQKLDALQTVLGAARATLADVAAAFAAGGDVAAPVRTMLQPAATNCAGLRSGRYAWVAPVENDVTQPGYTLVDLDATTRTVAYSDGTTTRTITLTDDGGCAYSIPDDGQSSSKILVSKSGIAIARDTDSAGPQAGVTFVGGVVVPLQTIPVAELAGTWNSLEYFRETPTAAFAPGRGSIVVDAAGTVASSTSCDSAGICRTGSITGDAFTVNPGGGFGIGGSATEPPSRAFAFKAPNGSLSMFLKYSNGRGMMVLAKQASLPLPPVGEVSNSWDFSIASSGAASTLDQPSTTVTAVDTAAGTYTRVRASDNRIDSFKTDDPQTGMRSRAANSCTANGAVVGCAGVAVMPLSGTGVTTYIGVAPANFFGISIAKP